MKRRRQWPRWPGPGNEHASSWSHVLSNSELSPTQRCPREPPSGPEILEGVGLPGPIFRGRKAGTELCLKGSVAVTQDLGDQGIIMASWAG